MWQHIFFYLFYLSNFGRRWMGKTDSFFVLFFRIKKIAFQNVHFMEIVFCVCVCLFRSWWLKLTAFLLLLLSVAWWFSEMLHVSLLWRVLLFQWNLWNNIIIQGWMHNSIRTHCYSLKAFLKKKYKPQNNGIFQQTIKNIIESGKNFVCFLDSMCLPLF